MESAAHDISNEKVKCEAQCMDLSRKIEDYMSAVRNAYEDDPEQMSVFILNVFELWVRMDKCAIAVYPLLADYYPWLMPELLDVLLMFRTYHMERLQQIQDYIHERCMKAKVPDMTIFSDPSPGGYIDRFSTSRSRESAENSTEDRNSVSFC